MSAPLNRLDRLAAALAARPARVVVDPARRLAAVALVFATEPESLLLIRRAERDGDHWSGQMALPGGRWSSGDPDLLATAMRETKEEVGLELRDAERLGPLDDVAPITQALPPIIVRPFVFRVRRPGPLVTNPEVAAAAWVPLPVFYQPDTYRDFRFQTGQADLVLPGYHLAEGVVWGMTERILTPLLTVLDG